MAIGERWKGFAELPPHIGAAVERLDPLFAREGVRLAYLFGSLARGEAAHDVDLALLVQGQPAYRLREPIADHLHTERLDLVDLALAPPVLRFEIVSTGRLLYAADDREVERFEMETLRLYRDTHHLRQRQRQMLRERFAQWSSNGKPSKHD
jgi:predicted nucleotidyltransferase